MNTEMAPTMKLAMNDSEAQTVIDALLDHIRCPNTSRNGVAVAWSIIAEVAIASHRRKRETKWLHEASSPS